jgi:ATP-dependent DNA ligase
MLLRRVAFPDFCEPCLPSPAAKPPAGAGWLHEIKHDGFRMLVRRDAAGVRLFTRNASATTRRNSSRRSGGIGLAADITASISASDKASGMAGFSFAVD